MGFFDLFRRKPAQTNGTRSARRTSPQEYFSSLLTAAFQDCAISTNISAIELSGFAADYDVPMPTNFLIHSPGGKTVFVIVISKDEYRLKRIKVLKNYCEFEGIEFMQFFYEFENAEDYVVNRIRAALG